MEYGTLRKQDKDLLAKEISLIPSVSRGGDVRFHLVYPNHYWLAMSNLGFQTVFALLAKESGVAVERGFLPKDCYDPTIFKEKWKSFETGKLLSDCDVLAFSLSFETDYPHLFRILNNQRLLFGESDERGEKADGDNFGIPLIVVGGTAVTLNPEPIADYVDVVFLGEAEEFITELVSVVRQGKQEGLSRENLLRRISELEGVYVPRFHTPIYCKQEFLTGYAPTTGFVPMRPKRRFVKDLSKFPSYTQILTSETEFKSMFLTETGRGCEMGCRFCVAGYIYRPVRKRSEESIADTVKIGLEKSNAVGFVGAAVSSHRAISKLAHSVAEKGARASLSSLMAQKISPELAASLSESEYKTVALAPEAGSERLRRASGKRVTNAQVVSAAEELAKAGIRGFKLYFMVGLPTETEEDVKAIILLTREVREAVMEVSRSSGRAPWVVLSVNPFIPKASTPFQWEPMCEEDELDGKIKIVKNGIKLIPNVEMNYESPRESYFQAFLSRGDRRVGKVLYEAEKEGKDWKWALVRAKKGEILGVPSLASYVTRKFNFDEFLPWEVVDSRIDKDLLMREALRAYEGDDFVLESLAA